MDLTSSFVDRISDLPDSLIHRILSFIDMKYAVQTCVLSKRWSEVWISLPFLNFDSSLYIDNDVQKDDSDDYVGKNRELGFTGFVKTVLLLRDNSDIMRFRLFLDKTFSGDPGKLIRAAVKQNVQELDIENHVSKVFHLTRKVFSCKSLRKLNLSSDTYSTLRIPNSVSLHQLNSLILDGFNIPGIESFNSLCSSCPLLELRLRDCAIGDEDELNFTIDSLYLQTLELDYVGVPVGPIIKLNAPNITSFIGKDEMDQVCSLGNFSSVVTADITISLDENNDTRIAYLGLSGKQNVMYGKRMMKFRGAINNVKDLKLSPGLLEVLSKEQPHKFCNLQHLKLQVWFTRGCMQATTYLLKISPNLKSIVLWSKESGLPDVGENWEAEPSVPCTLAKLKYVEIRGVEGCDNELKLLGFLLENALVLEKVVLFCRSTVGSAVPARQIMRFSEQLIALPKASSSVVMMLV